MVHTIHYWNTLGLFQENIQNQYQKYSENNHEYYKTKNFRENFCNQKQKIFKNFTKNFQKTYKSLRFTLKFIKFGNL